MNIGGLIRAHPLLTATVLGVTVRMILAPLLTRTFDVASWAEVIEDIRAGEGLYDVKGYYYTPLWGYFLNILAAIGNLVPGLDTLATTADVTFTEFFPHNDTRIPSLAFALFIKVPLLLFDIAVAYSLYTLVRMLTDDERKAVLAFTAWMALVPAIWISSVAGMFDNLSVLLLLLSLICLLSDRPAASGALIGLGAILKMYPGLAVIPITCYLLTVTNDRDGRIRKCTRFWVSCLAAIALVVADPLLKGRIPEAFYVFASRIKGFGTSSTVTIEGVMILCGMIALVAVSIFVYRFLQTRYGDPVKSLIGTSAVIIGSTMAFAFTQQYVLEVLPLLLLMYLVYGVGSKRLLILFSALFTVFVMGELPALLLTFEESVPWFSVDVLEGLASAINNVWLMQLMCNYTAAATQFLIVILSLYVLYDAVRIKRGSEEQTFAEDEMSQRST